MITIKNAKAATPKCSVTLSEQEQIQLADKIRRRLLKDYSIIADIEVIRENGHTFRL